MVDAFYKEFPGAKKQVAVRIREWSEGLFGPATDEETKRSFKAGYDPATRVLSIASRRHQTVADLRESLRHETLVHQGLGFLPEAQLKEVFKVVERAIANDPKVAAIYERLTHPKTGE